jgi:hypothetical protein
MIDGKKLNYIVHEINHSFSDNFKYLINIKVSGDYMNKAEKEYGKRLGYTDEELSKIDKQNKRNH